ncbi:YcaO-like family protein [Streptomyces sp. NPDC007896]|uniref:YcaO-like family protein n=1 Tax=Streptomyces sp. NPDC007896 TaxID=3364784 RepID=UPI0036E3E680
MTDTKDPGLGPTIARSGHSTVAPWVVPMPQKSGKLYLVGPRMALLGTREGVTGAALVAAGHQDFTLAAPEPLLDLNLGSARGNGTPDLILLDLVGRPDVWLLRDELAQQGIVTTSVLPDAQELGASDRTPVLVLADREPVTPSAWIRELLRSRPVLWAGECSDGTHVGPLFTEEAQLDDYLEATSVWASDRLLGDMGMRERPLPLLSGVPERPRDLARTVAAVLGGGRSDGAVLVDGMREVALWTGLRTQPRPPEDLLGELNWAKGLVKDLVTEPMSGDVGIQVVTCRTPCGVGTAEFESNSGKGATVRKATERALGETAERFAAWQANAAHGPRCHPRRYGLEDFHAFGELYEAHRCEGSPDIEWTTAVSLVSGDPYDVPACLVAFPYLPSAGHTRPSKGDTSGLASYPGRDQAVLRGLREVLERDSLYPNFMHQRPGTLLRTEPGGVFDDKQTFCVVYPDAPVPLVHAFVVDSSKTDTPIAARGTGSGLTWQEARERALEEARQLLAQSHRGRELALADAFDAWCRPDVTSQLLDYLEHLPEGDPTGPESGSASEQLASLVETLGAAGQDVLVAELPNPVRGWTAVRVLVPGATTNQWASASAGGRKLRGAVWTHGIPA